MTNAFKALSHPLRREILELLKSGPKASGDFADAFDVSWPTVTSHLNVLRDADLVSTQKQGTSVIYKLNTSVLEDVALSLFGLIGKTGAPEPTEETP